MDLVPGPPSEMPPSGQVWLRPRPSPRSCGETLWHFQGSDLLLRDAGGNVRTIPLQSLRRVSSLNRAKGARNGAVMGVLAGGVT